MEFIYLSKEQMALVDDIVVKKYKLQIKQMMENAGRNVARWIASELKPRRVVVLYGKGNNGGDALCAARHLKIYGCDITINPAFQSIGNVDVENQLSILKQMNIIPQSDMPKLDNGDVIIDGLLGYNIKGNPKDKYAELIIGANEMKDKGVKIVSYDLPSGMDPDTGECFEPCIQADYTMTLALPKVGLKNSDVGKLFLVNIGIPNELYKNELSIDVEHYFKDGDVVEVN